MKVNVTKRAQEGHFLWRESRLNLNNSMPDQTPAAPERTVVNRAPLGTLTLVSLSFNALILLLLLLGLVFHHHPPGPPPQEKFGRDRGWSYEGGRDDMSFHQHQRFGGEGRGWDGARGFGREGGMGRDGDQGEGREGFRGGPMHHDMGAGSPDWTKDTRPPSAMKLSDHIMDHLIDTLALTDAESTQIRPVIEAQVAQIQKDMEAAKQAQIKSMEDTTAKIRTMLNADQQKQLDALKTAEEQKSEPPAAGPSPADDAKPKPE
jgi:hypothetical protein